MVQNLLHATVRWSMRDISEGEQGVVETRDALVGAGFAGSEMILLVEDELFVREVAGNVLRSAGYQVLSARTAPEAIRLYDQCSGNVDLLLSDIVLPGLTGNELANTLRQRCSSLRVLLMTGYSMKISEIETGDSDRVCLPKPFSAQILLRTVRQVLDVGAPPRVRRVCGSG
jgi:CheY-like chemotaxis protein